MSYIEERVAAIARSAGGVVVGSLTWVDPAGQWWVAPLGSPVPDPDRPVPAAWVPVRALERGEL